MLLSRSVPQELFKSLLYCDKMVCEAAEPGKAGTNKDFLTFPKTVTLVKYRTAAS